MAHKIQHEKRALPPLPPKPPSSEMELKPTGIYVFAGPSAPPLSSEIDSPSNLGNEGTYDDTGFITQMDPQRQQCSSSEKDTNNMEMQKAYSFSPAAQGKDSRRKHVFILYGMMGICLVILVVSIFVFLEKSSMIRALSKPALQNELGIIDSHEIADPQGASVTVRITDSAISKEVRELHLNNSVMTTTVLKDLDDIQANQETIEKSLRNELTELQGITAFICKHLSLAYSSCPPKWTAKENTCYYFSSGTKTWRESLSYCIEQSAHLVSVESDDEQGFLRDNVINKGTHWLGMTDIEQDGKWRWKENDELVTISFWDIDEPRRSYNKDCGIMHSNGSWASAACSLPYHWICKKRLIC